MAPKTAIRLPSARSSAICSLPASRPRSIRKAGPKAAPAAAPADRAERQRQAISPRARRAAQQLGVDAANVTGSGKTGRIVERDILAAARTSPARSRSDRRCRGSRASKPSRHQTARVRRACRQPDPQEDCRANDREQADDGGRDDHDDCRCHQSGQPAAAVQSRAGNRWNPFGRLHGDRDQALGAGPRKASHAEFALETAIKSRSGATFISASPSTRKRD